MLYTKKEIKLFCKICFTLVLMVFIGIPVFCGILWWTSKIFTWFGLSI